MTMNEETKDIGAVEYLNEFIVHNLTLTDSEIHNLRKLGTCKLYGEAFYDYDNAGGYKQISDIRII